MTKGWKRESARHSLARKGIESGRKKSFTTSYPPLTKQDYYNIAERVGLGYGHRVAYVAFMPKAFPNERDTAYATEWAERFKDGTMFAAADSTRMKVLVEVYGVIKRG